jgi:hypothetical protein
MITKFVRKRNINTSLPFSNSSARIEIHANGSETFSFKKRKVSTPPSGNDNILTEAGVYLNNESSFRLVTN